MTRPLPLPPTDTDPAQLLAELQAAGVEFRLESGHVKFRAPFGRPLTVLQLFAVKKQNDELAALLEAANPPP